MKVIETLIFCDGCNENCGGDDRGHTAKHIRHSRALHDGWVYVRGKDYCQKCAEKRGIKRKPTQP